MFHCPECGEMVVAGIPHPAHDLLDENEGENGVNELQVPDVTNTEPPTGEEMKPAEKGKKIVVRAGITKNKNVGVSKAKRRMAKTSRRKNRKP